MSGMVMTKAYAAPPVCEREILRYAGCKEADETITALLDTCLEQAREVLVYAVCYREFSVTVKGDTCDFDVFSIASKRLADTLRGCQRVVLFAATVGVGMDRLIAKYGHISPAKALLLQAIGTERVEALCDTFCADIANAHGLQPCTRLSPGYGDIPLSLQADIFRVLDCNKHIGLSLGDSLLISPSKSVTAFVGLTTQNETKIKSKCQSCDKTDCAWRGAV